MKILVADDDNTLRMIVKGSLRAGPMLAPVLMPELK
jgi:hypothetical protein